MLSKGASRQQGGKPTSLRRVEGLLKSTHRAKATERTAREYRAWCEGRQQQAFPACYRTVAGYVSEKVVSLRGSAKSVDNWVSSLRVYSIQHGLPWLTEGDLYLLKKVRGQLALEDTTDIDRKHPFTLKMIQKAVAHVWRPKESPYDLLCATAALVAHNGLLRGGELLYGLRARDVTWESRNRSVSLHFKWTKTVRKGTGVDVRITDYPGPSAYKYLRRWYKQQQLHRKPKAYVFPRWQADRTGTSGSFDFRVPAKVRWLRTVIKETVKKLGFNPDLYSGHSFRAGGATDLFILRVPYPKIKKYGRWLSDAALVYYRDDIEVSAAVAKAFGRSRRMHRKVKGEYKGVGVRV